MQDDFAIATYLMVKGLLVGADRGAAAVSWRIQGV
jgi:hypothetical protein